MRHRKDKTKLIQSSKTVKDSSSLVEGFMSECKVSRQLVTLEIPDSLIKFYV